MLTGQPPAVADTEKAKPLPRQKLSCTKCRERKVKCDRTKPCSACCIRGAPKDCHFAAEAGDFEPIQQSYEIRKLRAENIQLKKRLQEFEGPTSAQINESVSTPEFQFIENAPPLSSYPGEIKRPFVDVHGSESIYFGTPSFSTVLHQFGSISNSAPASLTHMIPRDEEVFAPQASDAKEISSLYPFPTVFSATESIPQLWKLLPSQKDRLQYLQAFERRVNASSFPQIPIEMNKDEVERFLDGGTDNLERHPDMIALIFAALALGSQHILYSKAYRQLDASVVINGSIYIAAAMQALRLASFIHAPSVLVVQTLILMGPFLINKGRFLDAWNLFGITIRLAQSIGLHRHPQFLSSVPGTIKERSMRQALWWWLLHMDEQYSMTLGRPLGISSMGDCPWPLQISTDPIAVRFSDVVNRFTILARQVLGPRQLTAMKIDQYTREFRSLFASLPETLQFQESWCHEATPLPEWPFRSAAAVFYCKLHSYLILLNRQRDDKYAPPFESQSHAGEADSFQPVNQEPPLFIRDPVATNLGRGCVISSSEGILDCMSYLWERVREALHDWTIAQQAFNACTILLLDAIEKKSYTVGYDKVENAYRIFQEMEKDQVHELAGLAVAKLSAGIAAHDKIVKAGTTDEQESQEVMQTLHILDTQPRDLLEGNQSTDTVIRNSGTFLLENQSISKGPWNPLRFHEKADSLSIESSSGRNPEAGKLSSQSSMSNAGTNTNVNASQASLAVENPRKRRSTQPTPTDTPLSEGAFHSASESALDIMHDRIMRTAIPSLGSSQIGPDSPAPLIGPQSNHVMVASNPKGKWPATAPPNPDLFTTFPGITSNNIITSDATFHRSSSERNPTSMPLPAVPMRIRKPVAKRRRMNKDSPMVHTEARKSPLRHNEAVDKAYNSTAAPDHSHEE